MPCVLRMLVLALLALPMSPMGDILSIPAYGPGANEKTTRTRALYPEHDHVMLSPPMLLAMLQSPTPHVQLTCVLSSVTDASHDQEQALLAGLALAMPNVKAYNSSAHFGHWEDETSLVMDVKQEMTPPKASASPL